MNKKEIRKELIRIIKGSWKNDYMWYYDDEWDNGFPVFNSLIDLINKLGTKDDEKLPYDIYDIVFGKEEEQ